MADKYIIESGAGYFVEWIHGSPAMTTDIKEAVRLSRDQVLADAKQLESLGFFAKIYWAYREE